MTPKKEEQKVVLRPKVGDWFTAIIGGTPIIGKLQFDKDYNAYYLCQDVKKGASCQDTLGFKHSWSIGSTISKASLFSVIELNFYKTKPTKKNLPLVINFPEKFTFGCSSYDINGVKGQFLLVGCQAFDIKDVLELQNELSKLSESDKATGKPFAIKNNIGYNQIIYARKNGLSRFRQVNHKNGISYRSFNKIVKAIQ